MADARTLRHVLLDMEYCHRDLRGFAATVEMLGMYAGVDGIDKSAACGLEILGEIIGERIARLDMLLAEGRSLNMGVVHG